MSVSLPYLTSNKNVEALFAKIQSAKVPDKFSHDFLKSTIGLKGSNDRPLIPLLRTLGFIDQSGAPMQTYRALKNVTTAKAAIAGAVRKAYAPLFGADETANKLSGEKLRGLIAQVAGTDDDMTSRISQTFSALAKLGDFDASSETTEQDEEEEESPGGKDESTSKNSPARFGKGLHPSFHYNIQVHLPSNGSEEVYLNIFNALRKSFQ